MSDAPRPPRRTLFNLGIGGRAVRKLGHRVDSLCSALLALVLFVMMMVTFVDVVGRYLFSAPLGAAFEVGEIGLLLITYLGLPLITARQSHITVSFAVGFLDPYVRRARIALVGILTALVYFVIAWRLAVLAVTMHADGLRSWILGTPHWPLAALVSVLVFLSAIAALLAAAQEMAQPATSAETDSP